MNNTLIKSGSPAERVRQRKRVALDASALRLAPRDREELERALVEPIDYMYDESFSRANAYRKLFEQAPETPEPNVSWYRPVMEGLTTEEDLKRVANVVLTAAQERALFLQYNYARYRAARVRKQVGEGAVRAEEARELLHWRRLAERLRERIAQCNLALVLAMAKRVRHSDMDFADMISEGNMALLRAIDKFNVSKGFKFSTYACRAILKAFSRAGQKQTRYRELFPTDYDPALERSDHQERRAAEHERDCAEEVRGIVADNRAELTDIERRIISHRFALHGERDHPPLTLQQVGQLVGLTKERVRQIQNLALEKIRRTLEQSYLDRPGEEEAEAAEPTGPNEQPDSEPHTAGQRP